MQLFLQPCTILYVLDAIKLGARAVQKRISLKSASPITELVLRISTNLGFFDPFFRLHPSSHYSGSGLGLTLVKKIVEDHHGFVKAASTINAGTSINIYMPMTHSS